MYWQTAGRMIERMGHQAMNLEQEDRLFHLRTIDDNTGHIHDAYDSELYELLDIHGFEHDINPVNLVEKIRNMTRVCSLCSPPHR